jgi:hypothetical protein
MTSTSSMSSSQTAMVFSMVSDNMSERCRLLLNPHPPLTPGIGRIR